MTIEYRPDIDGLRALAVLPVVAFHADLPFFAGGFAGVDVFFVISGFLITSMILRELKEGRFSIFEFYKRRFLRILPALFAVIFATLVASYILLLPIQQIEVARSGLATTLFFSNIYFWQNQDYFRANAIEDPLLHTWSLGVEEQFYIIFPILLIVIYKYFNKRFLILTSIACALSFAPLVFCEGAGSAKFYLMPARFWELGLGALVAMGIAPKISDLSRSLVCLISFVCLVGSYALLSDENGFVGWLLVTPVVSTACLIAYLPRTNLASALSISPLRYIGKVSYSMYLWHWPILSFYFLVYGELPHGMSLFAYGIVLFIVSTASKEWLEDPVRYGWRPWSARKVNSTAIGMVVGAAFLCVWARDGLPNTVQISHEVKSVSDYLNYSATEEYKYQWRRGTCFVMETHEQSVPEDRFGQFDVDECLRLREDVPNVLVIGDSHSGHIWRALAERLPSANVMQASSTGCHPLLFEDGGRTKCRRLMVEILQNIVPQGNIDAIVFASRWRPEDGALLEATLEHVNPFVDHVLVFGPTPEFATRVPAALALRLKRNHSTNMISAMDEGRIKIDAEIESSSNSKGAYYVSLMRTMCSETNGCPGLTPNGVPVQFDYTHFTLPGARFAIERAETSERELLEFLTAVESASAN